MQVNTLAGCLSRFCVPFRFLPLSCFVTAACTGGAFAFLQACISVVGSGCAACLSVTERRHRKC